jgi:hypothetical protein
MVVVFILIGLFVLCQGLRLLLTVLLGVLRCCVVLNRARRRRITTEQFLLARAKTVEPPELDADWSKVRELEMEAYGAHYHRLDGTTLELGWTSLDEEEAEARRLASLKQDALAAMIPPGGVKDMTMAEYAAFRTAWDQAYAGDVRRPRRMFDD